jgi:hypothetical protein
MRNIFSLQNNGGAFAAIDSSLSVITSQFSNNTAQDANGGTIYLASCKASILYSSFQNGFAQSGGAVYATDSSVNILACSFADHNSGNGGTIAASVSTLTMQDCTVTNSVSSQDGGAVVLFSITAESKLQVWLALQKGGTCCVVI